MEGRKNTRETEEGKQEDERRNEGHCDGREGSNRWTTQSQPLFRRRWEKQLLLSAEADRSYTNSADARWEWKQSVQKCLTFCVALPPWDYGNVRGRSMIVAAAASETPTHSTEPIKKGEEQDREVVKGESEIITMTCENSPSLSSLTCTSHVLILLV